MAGIPGIPGVPAISSIPAPGGIAQPSAAAGNVPKGWVAAGLVVAQLCGTDTFATSVARPISAETSPGEPIELIAGAT